MAKLVTETMTITFSRIVRNDDTGSTALSEEARETLQSSLKDVFNEDSALIVEIESNLPEAVQPSLTTTDDAGPVAPPKRGERRQRRGDAPLTGTNDSEPGSATLEQ